MTERELLDYLSDRLDDFQEYICYAYNLKNLASLLSKYNTKGQYSLFINEVNDLLNVVAMGNMSEEDVTMVLPTRILHIIDGLKKATMSP